MRPCWNCSTLSCVNNTLCNSGTLCVGDFPTYYDEGDENGERDDDGEQDDYDDDDYLEVMKTSNMIMAIRDDDGKK
ncbi:hypothetical protein KIN20_016141 [Parelaphostrongylus tenuis]|uniref:Uncharacterized protein n=1 Tax=Parelaphostrongylus tenuis TaxID=148309 RepID=A0AAD5QMS1_PARTN|nr:hypothetical protein KIN20_016141 [Parelaphostrongylus tenuis]